MGCSFVRSCAQHHYRQLSPNVYIDSRKWSELVAVIRFSRADDLATERNAPERELKDEMNNRFYFVLFMDSIHGSLVNWVP